MPLGNRTPDEAIKQVSVLQEYVVVTKDSDFVDNLLLHGNVYKLLLVSRRFLRLYRGRSLWN